MKIFIYKTAIITIVFAITFEILIGSRVNDFKTIKAKLKRQLASLENNGWYS